MWLGLSSLCACHSVFKCKLDFDVKNLASVKAVKLQQSSFRSMLGGTANLQVQRQVGIKTKSLSWSWPNKSKIQNGEQEEGRNKAHEEHAVNWRRQRWNTQASIHEEGQVNKDQDQKRIREETKTGRVKQENTRGEAPQNNTSNKLDTLVRNTGTKPEYQTWKP